MDKTIRVLCPDKIIREIQPNQTITWTYTLEIIHEQTGSLLTIPTKVQFINNDGVFTPISVDENFYLHSDGKANFYGRGY